MKALYASAHIPAPWIAAHGLDPVRFPLWHGRLPRDSEGRPARDSFSAPPAGACPYAWHWLQQALAEPDAACLIFTTECDMMRRLAEAAAGRTSLPIFLFNFPKVAGSPNSLAVFRSELERLGNFLKEVGHSCVGHSCREWRQGQPAPQCQPTSANLSSREWPPTAIPLALVGGPLLPAHAPIADLIARAGGAIALDATETGELSIPPAPDPDLLAGDPLTAFAALYLEALPSVHRRPNTALYDWLAPRLVERAVRGILFVHYPWCDAWHAEARRVEERFNLPLLRIVLSVEDPLNNHLASRIEAFLETLR